MPCPWCKGRHVLFDTLQRGIIKCRGKSFSPKSIPGMGHANVYARANAKKRYHVRRCINAEEHVGAVGENGVGTSHAVAAVGPFARTSREKEKMALCEAN